VPAAAVIPAPIAYLKVAAVKKLVVGSRGRADGPPKGVPPTVPAPALGAPSMLLVECLAGFEAFTLKKLECSKQAQLHEYCS
jgi:hypothetical protein